MYTTNRLILAGAILLSLVACSKSPPPPPPAPPPPVAENPPPPVVEPQVPATPPSACPDVPAGTRVGPMGCPCEMTVQLQFKSDSADLTPEDQGRLDQAAENLTHLHWISGTIEGYTESQLLK